MRLDVPRLPPAEQRAIWEAALGERADGAERRRRRARRALRPRAARDRGRVRRRHVAGERELEPRALGVVPSARAPAARRPRPADRAAAPDWDDLVLPEAELAVLREIELHVRGRARVYEEWGFARKSARGLGISALFAGASGTGKTMAAEVLARELRLDLYRIDLSQVVSKYIGETEKNLRRVFDAAEAGGAILLFDEADALFGKRSEVKDSHDRYANIEVSYLLQRMEAYRGLAILTTNQRDALDDAFLRRIRFVVALPVPRRTASAPRSGGGSSRRRRRPSELDDDALAELSLAGGNIRNIALCAAFLAADEGEPVGDAPRRARRGARVREARAAPHRSGGARMALSPDVRLAVDELVLDGVEPDDPLVHESLARALAPALAAHGLEGELGPVATAAAAAVAREASREDAAQRRCACGGTPVPTASAPPARQSGCSGRAGSGRSRAAHRPRRAALAGRPLEPSVRGEMESPLRPRLLARPRAHGRRAPPSRRWSVNANAYTVGSDVVFGDGPLRTRDTEGSRLLAHELAHTIQQHGAQRPQRPTLRARTRRRGRGARCRACLPRGR